MRWIVIHGPGKHSEPVPTVRPTPQLLLQGQWLRPPTRQGLAVPWGRCVLPGAPMPKWTRRAQQKSLHRTAWEGPLGGPGIQPGQQLPAVLGSGRRLCHRPQGQGHGLMVRHQEVTRDRPATPGPRLSLGSAAWNLPWLSPPRIIPKTNVIQLSCKALA